MLIPRIVKPFCRWIRAYRFGSDSTLGVSPLYGKPLLLLCCLYSLNAWSLQVKSVTVESQLMRFPEISVDDIDYHALNFEYTVEGRTGILSAEVLGRTLQCGDSNVTHDYLSVEYAGPEVMLRITDKRLNRVLFLRQIITSGTAEYGETGCTAAVDINADFEAHRKEWLTSLNGNVLLAAQKKMEQYLKSQMMLSYESVQFPLFYFASGDSDLVEANRAFDSARAAFDLNREFGLSADVRQRLGAAARIWENKIGELDKAKSSYTEAFMRDNSRVRVALHRNLTAVYLFLNEFEKARRNDQLALSCGLAVESSMQNTIAEHQRRYLLSPRVAGNWVMMADAYRAGQNSIGKIKLVESGSFSGSKLTLSLN